MSSEIKYIKNPRTNRDLKVGGKTYKKLVKEGLIVDGKFVDKMVEPNQEQNPEKKQEKQENEKENESENELSDDQLKSKLLGSFKNIMDDLEMKYDDNVLSKKFDVEFNNL
jgi:uncharacterized membrane protein YcaP (DUF421 family)